jgi:hypothetical protein
MSELHAIAEVPERGAPPDIAAIYDEMRTALEMPLVNLIYRHFATHPGFLPWAWGVARPLAASGALQSRAQRLRALVGEQVASIAPPPVGGTQLAQYGLDAAAARAIGELVEFYNRGNCMNVLVMKLLLRALDAPSASSAPAPACATPRAARVVAEIPPIPAVEALSAADRALVAELNTYGEPGEPAALASLYRHAALWPGCLCLWRALLVPLERQGRLGDARRFTAERAGALAAELELPALAAPPPVEPRLRATIEGFSSVTICKMIPVGLLLALAFDDRRAPGS